MWAALVGAVFAIVAVATSFLPNAPYVPMGMVMVLFVVVFPVYGAAFLREMIPFSRLQRAQRAAGTRKWWQGTDRGLMKQLTAPVPKPVRVGFVVLFVVLWLAMMSSSTGPAGQPSTHDGRYFLNNHGDVTEVSRSKYDDAVATSTRGFAAGAAAFYSLGFIMCLYGPLLERGARTREPV